jgi:putative hemolysin
MISFLLILLIILLTLSSSFLSLSEIAFFSLSSAKVKAFRLSENSKKQTISTLLRDAKGLLVTIFFLNTVVNILVQNFSSDLLGDESQNWLLKVLIPLIVVLVFGELLPKYMGLVYNEQVATFAAPFYDWFQKISYPIRTAIYKVANFFSRILFFYLKVEKQLSKEELNHILETSEGHGLLHGDETKLIKGYTQLEDKQALDMMTPRGIFEAYDISLPLSKLLYLFQEKDLNEVYVYRGSQDQFLGMIRALDFFLHHKKIEKPEDLQPFLYTPLFLPETSSLKSVFEEFRSQKQTIILTVDEYGTISGVLKKNDMFNSLLKKEASEEKKDYSQVRANSIIAEGTMTLEKLNELFGQTLKSEYHTVTIGGYLSEKMGLIPQSGKTYQEGDLFFRVLQAEPTKVRKVYIQLQKERGPLL